MGIKKNIEVSCDWCNVSFDTDFNDSWTNDEVYNRVYEMAGWVRCRDSIFCYSCLLRLLPG